MASTVGFDKTERPEKKKYWSQILASCTLSLILFVLGLGNGWSSPYLAKLSSQENVDGIPKATDEEISWIASLINFGRIFGAVAGAVAQDTVGRKMSLYLSGVPMFASWACVAVATSVPWLYAFRFMCGISMGMIWCTMSHYLAEIADPEIRGAMILLNSAAHSVGLFTGNLIGPYLSLREFAYVSLSFCALFLVLFLLVPDSPYRYIMNGNVVEAEKSLQWLRRKKNVKKELQELQDYMSDSNVSFKRKLEEIQQPCYLKSFGMMFLINFFLFFCANNVINNYMEIIITTSKANVTPSTIVTIIGFCTIISGLMATFVIDRFGRRLLLIVSSLGIAIALTGLGIHFKLLELDYDPVMLSWLPCTCILIQATFFYMGCGCVPNTMVGELFSPSLKSVASLCFSGSSAITSAILTGTYLPLQNLIGISHLFWFYATGVYVSAVYYFFFVPETTGKSLKDIQEERKIE